MKRMLAAAFAAFALPAAAGDFTNLGALSQQEFRLLSEDLGAAFSYKGVTPAKRLGPVGFDIGIEVTQTDVENSAVFAKAGAGDQSKILTPKLHVNVARRSTGNRRVQLNISGVCAKRLPPMDALMASTSEGSARNR